MMMHSSAHIEAVNAVRQGWRVFPVYEVGPDGTCGCAKSGCQNPGKHPRVKEWPTIATVLLIGVAD